MADRYWVGGTGSWSGAEPLSNWSETSGGAGGASRPGNSDNVFFDANSGAGAVITKENADSCVNLDFTGFTGTFAQGTGAGLNIAGNLTLGAGMTMGLTAVIFFNGPAAAVQHLTSNGVPLSRANLMAATDATLVLDDDAVFTNAGTSAFVLTTGTLDLDGNDLTLQGGAFNGSNSNVRGVTFGGGRIILTRTSGTPWNLATATNCTLDFTGGGTIKFDLNAASAIVTFSGGGLVYDRLEYANANATPGELRIANDDNTFGMIYSHTPGLMLGFPANGLTTTIAAMDLLGAEGNEIVIQTTAGSPAPHLLDYSGVGIVDTIDYVRIQYSSASPADTWFAGANSIDDGNNSGWEFPAGEDPAAPTRAFLVI